MVTEAGQGPPLYHRNLDNRLSPTKAVRGTHAARRFDKASHWRPKISDQSDEVCIFAGIHWEVSEVNHLGGLRPEPNTKSIKQHVGPMKPDHDHKENVLLCVCRRLLLQQKQIQTIKTSSGPQKALNLHNFRLFQDFPIPLGLP